MSVKSAKLKATDTQAGRDWDVYYKNFLSRVHADRSESEADRKKRIKKLESDFEAWKVYYFPKYCYAPAAPFHVKASKRILENPEWYESRVWARELSKDVVCMMETIYQVLTGIKRNIMLVSNSWDKAADLLEPYRINLDKNERLINDYGLQHQPGNWTYGYFSTISGAIFFAVGADQSPRGSRNEEVRPDKVIFSDIDTDEDVLNSQTIDKRWKWIEKAVYPTRSVSKAFQVIFLGNLIANDCCVARAMLKADYVDKVNLEDKNGNSSWPDKNSLENIARIKAKICTAAYQGEYMNNPLSEGTTFKELHWGPVPPLNKFKFLLSYGDPAPSNKISRKGIKPNKALFLCGIYEGSLYVITGYLDSVTNAVYVDWYYDIQKFVSGKAQVYNYIENNSLQDPFYEQVFIPLFAQAAITSGDIIPISPDERKKPDKFSRIEGNLEPLNRSGRLILNEKEKGNPNMIRLEEQFKLVAPGLPASADGPDSVEGAFFILNQKMAASATGSFVIGERFTNSKRV
jgi:hypothetical protein